MAAEAADDEDAFDASLFGDTEESYLTDEDFSMLRKIEDDAEAEDADFLNSLLEDDD